MFLQLKTKNILVRKAIKEKEEAAVREAERDLANTNQRKIYKECRIKNLCSAIKTTCR